MGLFASAKDIASKGNGFSGGVKAMYEGIWPMTAEAIFKVGTRYFAYNMFKNWYVEKYMDGNHKAHFPMLPSILGGAFAGVVESYLVVIPCELLKVRHMTQTTYMPFTSVLANTIKNEGFFALYKGGASTALRQITNHMIRFPVFYGLSQYYKGGDSSKTLPPVTSLSLGFIAGTCSTICNTPLDVIKTRAQKQGNTLTNAQIVRTVVAEGGIPALWAGVTMRVIRVGPGQAITFAVFEYVSHLLGE